MASSTSRSFRARAGSTYFGGSPRFGGRDVRGDHLDCREARSSKSHHRKPSRFTPTVRSRAASRSPCAAAKARYACSHELATDVDPGAHVDADARKRSGHLALAQCDQELLRSDEGRDVHVGAADLDGAVGIAADPAWKIVGAGEFERAD